MIPAPSIIANYPGLTKRTATVHSLQDLLPPVGVPEHDGDAGVHLLLLVLPEEVHAGGALRPVGGGLPHLGGLPGW